VRVLEPLDGAVGQLAHDDEVDQSHDVAVTKLLELRHDLALRLGLVEAEDEELYRTKRHRTLPRSLTAPPYKPSASARFNHHPISPGRKRGRALHRRAEYGPHSHPQGDDHEGASWQRSRIRSRGWGTSSSRSRS